MLFNKSPRYLPSAEELPDSDETPVHNELQELIPGLLKAILLKRYPTPQEQIKQAEQRSQRLAQQLRRRQAACR